MIFVTVGTQLPFPRLLDAMNNIAPKLDEKIIAQCGPQSGVWPNLSLHPHLTPEEFSHTFASARVVVGHAGIGTILSAQNHKKPLILLPRHHALGEHRNDHQLATARRVETLPGIHVAWDVETICSMLETPNLPAAYPGSSSAYTNLIGALQGFIDE